MDYAATKLAYLSDHFDVVFDTVGALAPRPAPALLSQNGCFRPLNFGLREIMAALLNPLRSRKVRLAVKTDRTEHLVDLIRMIKEGKIEPQIHQMLSLDHAPAAQLLPHG